jgi:hypothetical protein
MFPVFTTKAWNDPKFHQNINCLWDFGLQYNWKTCLTVYHISLYFQNWKYFVLFWTIQSTVISELKGCLENSFQHCWQAWQDIQMRVYRETVNECNCIHDMLGAVYGLYGLSLIILFTACIWREKVNTCIVSWINPLYTKLKKFYRFMNMSPQQTPTEKG